MIISTCWEPGRPILRFIMPPKLSRWLAFEVNKVTENIFKGFPEAAPSPHSTAFLSLHQHQVRANRVAHSPSVPTKPAAETEDGEAPTTETIATRSTCSARVPAAPRLGSVP
jgi:hypothetical protein